MKIKTKLTSGIGLLFMIIVLLGVLAISYIDKLADDTKNILSDNYNSLDYAKGMLYALDNLETDREALNIFMENLEKQRLNITEINESEATDRLARHFKLLDENPSEQNIRQLRLDLNQIMSLNMASIQRNSVIAEDTARRPRYGFLLSGYAVSDCPRLAPVVPLANYPPDQRVDTRDRGNCPPQLQ